MRILISIRSLEHHFDVVDRADVTLANVDDDTRVLVLDQDNLVGFAFRLERDIWFCYHKFLSVDLGSNFDNGVGRSASDGTTDWLNDATDLFIAFLINQKFMLWWMNKWLRCLLWVEFVRCERLYL